MCSLENSGSLTVPSLGIDTNSFFQDADSLSFTPRLYSSALQSFLSSVLLSNIMFTYLQLHSCRISVISPPCRDCCEPRLRSCERREHGLTARMNHDPHDPTSWNELCKYNLKFDWRERIDIQYLTDLHWTAHVAAEV